MPRKGGRASRQESTPSTSSGQAQSGDDDEDEEEASSDASDEFFTNKKQKAKKRKATSSSHKNGKKKLRRSRQSESADPSDYASFAGKNAPRASTLSRSINYGEGALDTFSSEETEEDDEDDDAQGEDEESEAPKSKNKKKTGKKSFKEVEQEGDAVEGVFDHRRNEEMGEFRLFKIYQSAAEFFARPTVTDEEDDPATNMLFLVKWKGYSHLHSAFPVLSFSLAF